jgi:hypothetical protein
MAIPVRRRWPTDARFAQHGKKKATYAAWSSPQFNGKTA